MRVPRPSSAWALDFRWRVQKIQNPHPNVAKNATLGWGTRANSREQREPTSTMLEPLLYFDAPRACSSVKRMKRLVGAAARAGRSLRARFQLFG